MQRLEELWLTVSIGILVIFMIIIGYQTFALSMGPPSHKETLDPQKVDQHERFSEPGVKQIGSNEYEVVMTLESFAFNPGNLEVPVGAKVHFIMTSKDVTHGFQVPGTNINAMVMPGHIQKISHTFSEPGEFLVVCNEYCGIGHQAMSTTITVK
ncbi:cytochrome c oxidase subunit II [Aquibacillus koreensis]|uniref:Cytochrome aa3 subunit 2 n=1 Tax=Aquibacillus koreensis TaxID=279446 RepID=A0A9X3WNA0_9BACI|nr:cytochrome c oxidase subunit II [Aquibacillus koreensis]MCT2536338.1 cytochrome c oxidase subunit II [Aquibacillus koreensis]MDC3421311.1 cytochrome c oxidase subunit II [Aquibacillus koreensis]